MKRTILILFTFFILILGIQNVSASTVKSLANTTAAADKNCQSLLGSPSNKNEVAYYLQMGLDIFKYVGIVLCIVLTVSDFAKALFGDNKEILKDLTKTAFTRLIWVVVLFFIPIIVKFVLTLLGAYGTCGIS